MKLEKATDSSPLPWAALILSLLAIGMAAFSVLRSPREAGSVSPPRATDVLERIARSGTLRVGYGGFPPYTVIDLKEPDEAKRVTGLSVDLVNEIARRQVPPLRVEWHKFSWDTLKADMSSDRFDFVAEPVFQTIPRALDFQMGEPYAYFGIAVALVRSGETRFREFSDLDRADITIALAEGWTSSEYARQHLSKPVFKPIPVTDDANTQLDEVLYGRADAALNDVPSVAQYAQAHAGKVKALWLDNPPATVPGGFMTRRSDPALRQFLDVASRIIRTDGTLSRLDRKWRSYAFLPTLPLTPGQGLDRPSVSRR